MKKLNIANYEIDVVDRKTGEKRKEPYEVRESLVGILLSPHLQLKMAEFLENEKVALKILDCKEEKIKLEDAEFAKIKNAFDTFQGFTRNDGKLIHKIKNVEEIEVEEKKK